MIWYVLFGHYGHRIALALTWADKVLLLYACSVGMLVL